MTHPIPALMTTELWLGWMLLAAAVIAVCDWWVQRHFSNVIVGIFDRDAPFRPREAAPIEAAESFTLPTPDGLSLQASLIGNDSPDAPLVVFCPEFGASRWTASFYAAGLIEAGFAVLTFDFRNQGDSEAMPGYEPTHWLTEYELTDLRTVMTWVARSPLGHRRLAGMMGMSRGGCAALCVAAERPTIPAVFVEGVYTLRGVALLFIRRWGRLHLSNWIFNLVPRWHLVSTFNIARRQIERRRGCRFVDLEKRLASLRGREVVFVSGQRDSYVPLDVINVVVDEAKHDRSSLWRVPKAKHNRSRDIAEDDFDQKAVELFQRSIDGGRASDNPDRT